MSDGIPDVERDELENFIQEYMDLDHGGRRPSGIYSIIRGYREEKYQGTLTYFLDPKKPHGFGYAILETFLDCIGFHEFNLTGQHIEIDDEVGIADDVSDGRIDLVICAGKSLDDHPQWAVFVELKVNAPEGESQTTTYANTEKWRFNWFGSDEVSVNRLDDTSYVYVKKTTGDEPVDDTDTFVAVTWSDLVERFETELQESIFNYPHRSVIQFTDFIQSVKETEGMETPIDEDEIAERLDLYFEHRDLIQRIENANSQFESDFEACSTYLRDNWVNAIDDKYNFETSGWKTRPSKSVKYQGILPKYWHQDPLDRDSKIILYFHHSPTTDHLRNQTLTFRLRLPPARNVHTEKRNDDRSFNDVFTERCTTEYADRLTESLQSLNVDDDRLGSAASLVEKNYPLDPQHLVSSYLEQLDTALYEFCSRENEFLEIVNEVFEDTYRVVFEEDPAGAFPGYLPKQG